MPIVPSNFPIMGALTCAYRARARYRMHRGSRATGCGFKLTHYLRSGNLDHSACVTYDFFGSSLQFPSGPSQQTYLRPRNEL